MLWVDVETYEGPDRRQARQWRLLDRRRENAAHQPPSMATKLRQLRVRALNVATPEDRAIFAAKARAASLLAEQHRRRMEARALEHLAEQVLAMPLSVNLSDWLDHEIEALIHRTASRVA